MTFSIGDSIRFVIRAINKVDSIYYGSLDWIQSMSNSLDFDLESEEGKLLLPHLSKHYERVFCYELYHQLRKILEEQNVAENLFLQAELKKDQISNDIENLFDVKSLDGAYYPDFLLHMPTSFENQYLIMEVKADSKLSFNSMKDDILKIDQFIERYNYKKGIFLAINIDQDKREKLLTHKQLDSFIKDQVKNPESILILFKEAKDKEIYSRNLAKLISEQK